jgi:RimK family alpha-L-glutamate ligase
MAAARSPVPRGRDPLVAIVGWPQETNDGLARAWEDLGLAAVLLKPDEARSLLRAGDVAVGRFDVLDTLDGVQPGSEVLDELELRGVRVLNRRAALVNAHDKLRSARLLRCAHLPHPRTSHLTSVRRAAGLELPVVIKPRFGSWGVDVFRCETERDLARTLSVVSSRPWFRRHGAVAQELLPPRGYDLRVVVAGGRVVGATERVARPGEWRTNVSLGGTKRPARPAAAARSLATAAAAIIGTDLVGVDLLPVGDGHVVLELNGAVEFDRSYDLDAANVFASAASALGLDEFARCEPRASGRSESAACSHSAA